MGKPSREKGKRGEREVVNILKSHGLPAYRSQQYKGAEDSPDVLLTWYDDVAIEVKRRERYSVNDVGDWLKQATSEAGEDRRLVAVFHRANGKPWQVTMDAKVYAELIEGVRT